MNIIVVATIALKWEFNKNKDPMFVTDMVNEKDCVITVLKVIRNASKGSMAMINAALQ